MDKLQFDSLYKFIVSIGLIILILPIAFISLIMQEDSILYISNLQMLDLTDTAQKIIAFKQAIMLKSITSVPFYLVYFGISTIGVVIILYGFNKWKLVQTEIDKTTKLENTKLAKEIGMDKEEKEKSLKEEIKFDKDLLGVNNTNVTLNDYIRTEEIVATEIINQLRNTHEIVTNAKVGPFEYDVIAKGKGFLDKDYIFEIKLTSISINKRWIDKVIERLDRSAENYMNITNRIPKKILVVVSKNKQEDISHIIDDYSNVNNLRIIFTNMNNIKNTQFKS